MRFSISWLFRTRRFQGKPIARDRFRAQINTDHPVIVRTEHFSFSGRFLPLESMMQPTDPWQSDYLALAGGPGLYRSTAWRSLFKAQVRPIFMIIFEIRTKNSCQVSFVQDDDMVCALSPDRAYHPLHKRIGLNRQLHPFKMYNLMFF